MRVWTSADPGAGDMSVVVKWGSALTAQADAADSAARELYRLGNQSSEHWEGAGATAFLTSLARRQQALALMIDACRSSVSAAGIYVDQVNQIKTEVEVLRSRARSAEVVLAFSDAPPPAVTRLVTDEQRAEQSRYLDATQKISHARKQLSEVATSLSDLAERRHVADQEFMSAVAGAMSGKIKTQHSRYKPLSAGEWEEANSATMGFLKLFARGGAPRDASYIDDGLLISALADSGHVRHVRDAIARRLATGELLSGDEGSWRRELGSDKVTLLSDALNAATVGKFGNLAETMLGSYALEYEIVEVNRDVATVTFTATNDTTRESLNRIPDSDLSMPWAGHVDFWHDRFGGFQSTGETIVWTEIIEVK